ncbi:MAG TPA: winged helix-turn-helix domain-containing protein [Acidobacteriota bacterium]|nr:winged helix-turn-helix domain-containing protein [Acidobacteriota bacterium]
MTSDRTTCYRFAPGFTLSLGRGALYRKDANLNLRPKTFKTLHFLLQNPGRLVTKQELMDRVWSDATVTDDVLVQSIADIRRALGDDARNPSFIRTVPRRGYVFMKPVEAEEESLPQEGGLQEGAPSAERQSASGPPSSSSPADGISDENRREPGAVGAQERQGPRTADPAAASGRPLNAASGAAGDSGFTQRDEALSADAPANPPSSGQRRKARLPFLIPALLLILTVAALAAWQVVARWGAEATPADQARPLSMAVFPFDVQSDQEANRWLSRGLADLVSTGLWNAPGLEIVSQRRLNEASLSRPLSADKALAAARRAGVERFVIGHFYRLGDQIQINASLVDSQSGQTAFTVRERLSSTDEIFRAVDAICLKVLQNLAVERGLHPPQGTDISEFTTPSLEAYRHYITGLDHFLRGGQNGAEQARIELEKAIRVDPSFAMAHFKLAQVEHWAASWGYIRGSATEALTRALPFTAELPEKERLLLRGLEALWIDGNADAALGIYDDLSDRFPAFAAEAGIPSLMVQVLTARGELQQAIRVGQSQSGSAFLAAEERSRLCADMAQAYRNAGQLQEAVEMGQKAVELWPLKESSVYAYQLINLGRYYLDQGLGSKALEQFAMARPLAQDDPANLTDLGWGHYMLGDKEEALQLASAALRLDPEYGNAHHLTGWIHLAEKRFSQAATSLTRAFELTPPEFGWSFHGILDADLPALYYSGVAYQKLGNRIKAGMIFDEVALRCRDLRGARGDGDRPALDLVQTYTYEAMAQCRRGQRRQCMETVSQVPEEASRYYELTLHLARIHALLGQPEEALEWLERSIRGGNRQFQHLRDNPDFESLAATPRFLRLVEAPSGDDSQARR